MFQRIRQRIIRTATTGVVTLGTVELLTSLPSEGRSSEIYHKCADFGTLSIRKVVSDAEDAHNIALKMLEMGLGPTYRSRKRHYHDMIVDTSSTISYKVKDNANHERSATLKFPNCVGLAAGFDKNGVAIQELLEMGFGFVEIGSVTPEPQPGNAKPRLYRLEEDHGVINRYGFNSEGLDSVESNVLSYFVKAGLDSADDVRKNYNNAEYINKFKIFLLDAIRNLTTNDDKKLGLLGINLGKNKWRTSVEEAVEDYTRGIGQLGPYADYLVINISSPNTPGLRSMQRREPLICLLQSAIQARNMIDISKNSHRRGKIQNLPPLFVKIAPDLTIDEMEDIADVVRETGVDGIVISNTTNSRPQSLQSKYKDETGGLSGKPLKNLSTECISTMYKLTDGKVPIIGVGGVENGYDVYEKLRAGASVVQLYSMLTYKGPGQVARIRKELAMVMKENGNLGVSDVIGLDHDEIFWRKLQNKIENERNNEPLLREI